MSTKRVVYEQLEILFEFLNQHKDLAMGYNKSAQAREMSRRMWMEVAAALNSVTGGAVKDFRGWAAYWVDYKGKLKRKCAAAKRSQSRTGGGPPETSVLTDIEKKYLTILGENYGLGLPDIQVDPFDVEITVAPITHQDGNSSTISQSILDMPGGSQVYQILNTGDTDGLPIPATETQPPADQQQEQPATPTTAMQPTEQRRRAPTVSQSSVRGALMESSQQRADATKETSETLKNILGVLTQISVTLEKISISLAGLPTSEK